MKKKICLALVMLISFTVLFPANIFASDFSVGDILGDVLNTNVRTYINGERIPNYNINNRSVIILADLRNYGFDVVFNDETRVSSVTRNYGREFTPIEDIADNTERAGTVAFQYVYTDIIAVLNGREVESFNVRGRLAIFFGDLRDFGDFEWDGEANASRLTLNDGRIVITPTGRRYHFYNCRTVGENWQYITREEAREAGYTACAICRP